MLLMPSSSSWPWLMCMWRNCPSWWAASVAEELMSCSNTVMMVDSSSSTPRPVVNTVGTMGTPSSEPSWR